MIFYWLQVYAIEAIGNQVGKSSRLETKKKCLMYLMQVLPSSHSVDVRARTSSPSPLASPRSAPEMKAPAASLASPSLTGTPDHAPKGTDFPGLSPRQSLPLGDSCAGGNARDSEPRPRA